MPQFYRIIVLYCIANVIVNKTGHTSASVTELERPPPLGTKDNLMTNLLVLKGVGVNCSFSTDRRDVSDIVRGCEEGKVNMFEYNSKFSKVCKALDMYNMEPFRPKEGSYVVMNKKIFEEISDEVEFKTDLECGGDTTSNESKNLYELLAKANELGKWVSLDLTGNTFKATYCWTIKRKVKKDNNVLLGKLKKIEPRTVKYKTTQCHINGSIQPDNYNNIFYPGDVIPAVQ